MNMDDFEQRLRQQPWRAIPDGWRDDILGPAAPESPSPATRTAPSTTRLWFWEWLWPSPVAWGALAACWIAILALQHAARPSNRELTETRANARMAAAYQAVLRQYHESELKADFAPAPPADRTRQSAPGQSRSGETPSSPGIRLLCRLVAPPPADGLEAVPHERAASSGGPGSTLAVAGLVGRDSVESSSSCVSPVKKTDRMLRLDGVSPDQNHSARPGALESYERIMYAVSITSMA